MKDLKNYTWKDVVESEGGTKFLDKFDEGVRFMILKGGCALCAYVGVPSNHPLAGFEYDDLPIDVHGGLTFCQEGDGEIWDKGFYWYGWDYSHSGDYSCYYDKEPMSEFYESHKDDKKWLPEDVEKDSWSAIWDFKRLVKLSEAIVNKKIFYCSK